jgi:hypothetical protein
MLLAIIRLLVQRVNHSAMLPHLSLLQPVVLMFVIIQIKLVFENKSQYMCTYRPMGAGDMLFFLADMYCNRYAHVKIIEYLHT